MSEKNSIVVYGASSNDVAEAYKDAAYLTGCFIAARGIDVVCGGGRSGLMARAIEGALSVGGRAIGVLPEFMIANRWHHPRLSETIITPDMHSRKRAMAAMARSVIALPGGCGTLEELLEIITWRQLGLYDGNIVILNVNGYYNPLIEMLGRTISEGFMRDDHSTLWSVAATPDEAVTQALSTPTATIFSQKIE